MNLSAAVLNCGDNDPLQLINDYASVPVTDGLLSYQCYLSSPMST